MSDQDFMVCDTEGCSRAVANFDDGDNLCCLCYADRLRLWADESPSDVEADKDRCYEAIKKARVVRRLPVKKREEGLTYTSIPMALWEVLQPVIEVYDD